MQIRAAMVDEYALLPKIERQADELFAAFPEFADLEDQPCVVPGHFDQMPKDAVVLVAEFNADLAGFVYGYPLDDCLFIGQISVVPEAQNKGIGTQLLDAFVAKAKEQQLRGVTLITYAHISFNAPFYAEREFHELFGSEMGPALRKEWAKDIKKWGRYGPRVVMGNLFTD